MRFDRDPKVVWSTQPSQITMGIRIKSHKLKGDNMDKKKKLDKIEDLGMVMQGIAFLLFIPYVLTDSL
jgi:hypothetical protein